MKCAIFSDVHSNLEALEKVVECFEQEKIDHLFFLGDIVGYGASPRECLDLLKKLIKERDCFCVAGNHDYAVCGKTPYEHYAVHARTAIEWTQQRLSPEEMGFLSHMPLMDAVDLQAADLPTRSFFNLFCRKRTWKKQGFMMTHSGLVAPQEWGYIGDIDDAQQTFKVLKHQLCFIGHSHKPIIFTSGNSVDWEVSKHINIQDNLKYIINVGSVGQPRDGNPMASFAIYDTKEGSLEIKRVHYDVEKAQNKIQDAGLPQILADRLGLGK